MKLSLALFIFGFIAIAIASPLEKENDDNVVHPGILLVCLCLKLLQSYQKCVFNMSFSLQKNLMRKS